MSKADRINRKYNYVISPLRSLPCSTFVSTTSFRILSKTSPFPSLQRFHSLWWIECWSVPQGRATNRNDMAKVHTGVAARQAFRQRNNRQLQRHKELRDSQSSTVEFPPTIVVRQNSRHRFVSRFKIANVFNHSTTNTIGVHKVKHNASENTFPHIFKNLKHVQKSIYHSGCTK